MIIRLWRQAMYVMIYASFSFSSVMVNQAGYLPGAKNIFYSTAPADSFYITAVGSQEIVYRGNMVLSKANDPASGATVYRGDFSPFMRTGSFVVTTSAHETSVAFEISPYVFREVAAQSLKGFYFQRCGMTLTQQFAGVYSHNTCHTADGIFHSSTDTGGTANEIGGWHDAGDFGKYIVNAGISVGTLMMAYESFPSKFDSDHSNIPESGNGIPDILDESQYELRWMLKMQHWNGGVYFKLTREQFAGFVMPQNDNATRFIYQISTTATGDFAAVCARAARIFKQFDPPFSDSCLSAARRAWQYLQDHTNIVPSGGFTNPSGTATGEYGDANDSDERLWAAAELFATTGESEFASYYTLHYSGALFSQSMNWSNVRSMAHLAYLYASTGSSSASIQAALRSSLVTYASALSEGIANDGFNVSIHPGEYYWGSNSEALNRAIVLIYAYRESGDTAFVNDALSQLNYVLGCNINNISYVTGVGVHHIMHPHHRPSASDGILEPVPGLLAGGPDQYRDDAVLQSLFSSGTPPARCYSDNQDSYASNEIAINWNAPLVFVAGFFSVDDFISRAENTTPRVPTGFNLYQNFPNPFNPATTIQFTLPSAGLTTLRIYDLLGRNILTVIDNIMGAGDYSFRFIPETLPSGVYIYSLESGAFYASKKMIVLR